MNKTSPALVQGFTLIEMTVVLLLITLLASVAIRETNSLSFQVRYEQTQERLERIREAILGNPRQIINGQQAVSGFVADMGRLPNNLHELLEREFCSDRKYSNDTCVANGGTLITQQNWAFDSSSGLWYGWRGPYLNISGSALDDDAFVDGWGRLASDKTDQNYGWRVEAGLELNTPSPHPKNSNRIVIQSYGKDHKEHGTDYDADYPSNRYSIDDTTPYKYPAPLIDQEDWLVNISGGISINLLKKYGTDSYCGFFSTGTYPSERDCLNAGGTWGGSCSLTISSCKSVGGHWQSCFFSPSACVSAGGTSTGQCQFTKKSCNAADGDSTDIVWSADNQCTIPNATACANAGGTWNATLGQCDFSPQQCSNAGGAWVNDCTFTDTNCTAAGGTLENTTLPHSCSFTQAACHAQNGQSTGRDCYMSHAEFTGAKYVAEGCQTASGSWTARLCMNLFYRDPDTSAITKAPSLPVTIDENGGYQTVQFFILDANDIDNDTNITEPMPYLPIGPNAIGIYEYDGDCDLDNPLYPADRKNPIQVDFHPRAGFPVINW